MILRSLLIAVTRWCCVFIRVMHARHGPFTRATCRIYMLGWAISRHDSFTCVTRCVRYRGVSTSALQHTATHCNTLHHTATHCKHATYVNESCPTCKYIMDWDISQHDSFTCVTRYDTGALALVLLWLIPMRNVTVSHVWHDLFTRGAWLINMCGMTSAHVWHITRGTRCDTGAFSLVHRNTLQHTATHCNTLQHIANTSHTWMRHVRCVHTSCCDIEAISLVWRRLVGSWKS